MPAKNLTQRIARHAFGQLGLYCIQAVRHPAGSCLSISTAGQWQPSPRGAAFWFKTRKAAENLLSEIALLEAVAWRATCHDGDVIVDVPLSAMADVIEEASRWVSAYGCPVPAEEIADRMAGIEREICRIIPQLQQTGAMQILNRTYKALRTAPRAPGEKGPPSYKVWLAAELERLVLQALSARA